MVSRVTFRLEVLMRKCESCGGEMSADSENCPSCGVVGGAETVTDLPSGIKKEMEELREEIRDERKRERLEKEATCRSCGATVYEDLESCPSCGTVGGAETITDLPKLHLREAHRKLKEEIKEAHEKHEFDP